MLYIKKGSEPISLTSYKKKSFVYFDGCNKDDIRRNLLKEQGYLCAYCMRRIHTNNMKIEHWYPEDRLTEIERLNYNNMLGCCKGHMEGHKGEDDTCDTHKRNQIITINPTNYSMINEIKYRTKSGEIYSDNIQIEKDLNKTLNLNSKKHLLKENRKAVIDAVILELNKKRKKGNWNRRMIQNLIDNYETCDEQGRKKEFAGIVLWYLNKKLKQIQ